MLWLFFQGGKKRQRSDNVDTEQHQRTGSGPRSGTAGALATRRLPYDLGRGRGSGVPRETMGGISSVVTVISNNVTCGRTTTACAVAAAAAATAAAAAAGKATVPPNDTLPREQRWPPTIRTFFRSEIARVDAPPAPKQKRHGSICKRIDHKHTHTRYALLLACRTYIAALNETTAVVRTPRVRPCRVALGVGLISNATNATKYPRLATKSARKKTNRIHYFVRKAAVLLPLFLPPPRGAKKRREKKKKRTRRLVTMLSVFLESPPLPLPGPDRLLPAPPPPPPPNLLLPLPPVTVPSNCRSRLMPLVLERLRLGVGVDCLFRKYGFRVFATNR